MGQPGQTSLGERLRGIEAEIAAGQIESAMAHCQAIFAQYPRALAVQRTLGEVYLAQRQPREALGALDRALAGDPEDVRACCDRAVIHQMHGDPVAALNWYRRACDVRPDDQALRTTYREMAARIDRPPYQPSRVGLARLYMRGGQFTHAVREWETLIAENSDLLEAQVGLVETLWRAERTQEAEDRARRVLMNAPACVKPLLIVGVIARASGRVAEAERFLQRAEELDPEHRIAHELFADRAMDDVALRTLFWRQAPSYSPAAPADGQRNTLGPQRASNGPRLTAHMAPSREPGQPLSLPTSPAQTGRPSLTDLGAALSRPDLSANLSRPLGQPARPQNLPPEFHSMFRETANMIWAPDESDPGAQPTITTPTPQSLTGAPASAPQDASSFMRTTAAPASGDISREATASLEPTAQPLPQPQQPQQPRLTQPMQPTQPMRADLSAPFDASAQFMPPALAASQEAMGDTESRRAIRWVQWLQAQGARRRSEELARGRPTGSLDALLNTPQPPSTPGNSAGAPPPWPFARPPQLPLTSLPSTGPMMAAEPSRPAAPSSPSAPDSGDLGASFAAAFAEPQTAPKSEELRQMFAQLEPDARANGASVPPASDFPLGPATPVLSDSAPLATDQQWPEALADAFEWPSQPGASTPRPAAANYGLSGAQPTPDVTLEALEDAHSAHGYQPFTLEPGALAAFTGAEPAHAHEATSALDTFFQGPEEPPLPPVAAEPLAPPPTPAPEPLPEPLPEPAIDPADYHARLEAARSLRDADALDEALVEYRAILKNSPDLLPDALSDLESALEEHPEHPELHRLLGDARIRQGDYMAALESLNRSVALDQPDEE